MLTRSKHRREKEDFQHTQKSLQQFSLCGVGLWPASTSLSRCSDYCADCCGASGSPGSRKLRTRADQRFSTSLLIMRIAGHGYWSLSVVPHTVEYCVNVLAYGHLPRAGRLRRYIAPSFEVRALLKSSCEGEHEAVFIFSFQCKARNCDNLNSSTVIIAGKVDAARQG